MAVCLACLVTIAAAGIIFLDQTGRSVAGIWASAESQATPSAPPLPTYKAPATVSPTPSSVASPVDPPTPTETATPAATATPTPDSRIPGEIQQGEVPNSAFEDLTALLAADYPARDYYETASRLGRAELGKRMLDAQDFQVGDRKNFITDDGLREAVMVIGTEHAYFWFESSLNYDQKAIERAAQKFEDAYYPVVAKLYGANWQNGIDDDPRFSVLHLDGYADGTELGFFSSGDQFPRTVNASSNEQEVIYLNMDNVRLGEPLYFGTLVHELEHLILWHSDPNETIWLSEGLAQFTELYVGLDTVDTVVDYLNAPGTRLDAWTEDRGDEVFAHYGAAYLFVVYLWEQYGDQAIQDLVKDPADGLAGVSAVLARHDPSMTLDQFVLDWATANYVDSSDFAPSYDYEHLSLHNPKDTVRISQAPFETIENAEQFGVSYINLDLTGEHLLSFAGDSTAELVPTTSHSGDFMWYVPALDELDAQLTASFDLTGLDQVNLTFWTWYDLEDGYDFAYVSASGDGGATWDLLAPSRARPGEYGPGLTGRSSRLGRDSGGWVQVTVPLTGYAGGAVIVRFEVLSDSAIVKRGFAVDDIAIPELGYFDNVETDSTVWLAQGFVRTGPLVPQIWRLNLVLFGPAPRVVPLDLVDGRYGTWAVDFGDSGGELVITAQTPFVGDPTTFWLAVDPPN